MWIITYISFLTLVLQIYVVVSIEETESGVDLTPRGDEINTTVENDDDIFIDNWFNPVLQNHTALLDYMDKHRRRLEENLNLDVKLQSGGKPGPSRARRSISELDCGGLCSRSLCPWNEEWDDEPRRIPRFIKYAECVSATSCSFSMDGVNERQIRRLQRYTYCDKVRTDIQVIEDNEEKWLTHWPIACICSRHPTHSTDNLVPNRQFASLSRVAMHADFPGTRTNDQGNSADNRSDQPRNRLRMSTLTRDQLRHLRQQRRRILHRSESFEELMARRRSGSRRRPLSHRSGRIVTV